MKRERRRIIIDTDPGIDDAVAILLALASPALEVRGLTVVAGNAPLRYTVQNALAICELAGRPEIKVFAGCAEPLKRPLVTASIAHGETGLGDADLPAPVMAAQAAHAVDWLIEEVMAAPAGATTLCALGPLGNVATAFAAEPRLARHLREIVIMGGAGPSGGNITPAAEFNIYADPDAAAVVFESGARLTLVPLDLTRQAICTSERLERIRAIKRPAALAVARMLSFYNDPTRHASRAADPLHDACVIGYLLRPDLYAGHEVNVAVETVSDLTRGMTAMDLTGVSGRPANCRVLHRLDAVGFYKLLIDALARL